eukprot:TRINITY_DN2773_c2_g1_i1.p1 TRINITY_DN2773_c2_g1~~TRINITY_DN2773_c2_g1_i1.p1  ORF type:complete len:1055 (+),score=230.91 TRINITY_DN2773_c2_g1_i1:86-3250(+)
MDTARGVAAAGVLSAAFVLRCCWREGAPAERRRRRRRRGARPRAASAGAAIRGAKHGKHEVEPRGAGAGRQLRGRHRLGSSLALEALDDGGGVSDSQYADLARGAVEDTTTFAADTGVWSDANPTGLQQGLSRVDVSRHEGGASGGVYSWSDALALLGEVDSRPHTARPQHGRGCTAVAARNCGWAVPVGDSTGAGEASHLPEVVRIPETGSLFVLGSTTAVPLVNVIFYEDPAESIGATRTERAYADLWHLAAALWEMYVHWRRHVQSLSTAGGTRLIMPMPPAIQNAPIMEHPPGTVVQDGTKYRSKVVMSSVVSTTRELGALGEVGPRSVSELASPGRFASPTGDGRSSVINKGPFRPAVQQQITAAIPAFPVLVSPPPASPRPLPAEPSPQLWGRRASRDAEAFTFRGRSADEELGCVGGLHDGSYHRDVAGGYQAAADALASTPVSEEVHPLVRQILAQGSDPASCFEPFGNFVQQPCGGGLDALPPDAGMCEPLASFGGGAPLGPGWLVEDPATGPGRLDPFTFASAELPAAHGDNPLLAQTLASLPGALQGAVGLPQEGSESRGLQSFPAEGAAGTAPDLEQDRTGGVSAEPNLLLAELLATLPGGPPPAVPSLVTGAVGSRAFLGPYAATGPAPDSEVFPVSGLRVASSEGGSSGEDSDGGDGEGEGSDHDCDAPEGDESYVEEESDGPEGSDGDGEDEEVLVEEGEEEEEEEDQEHEEEHSDEESDEDEESAGADIPVPSSLRIDAAHVQCEASLGVGSFGAVRRGTLLGAPVAIKRMHSSDRADVLCETLVLARLRHPYVLQVCGIVRDQGELFMVTEYCALGDVNERVTQADREARAGTQTELLWRSKLDWLHSVACALSFIHMRGLVHRDLKGENVMLATGSVAKLGDFGLAATTATAAAQGPAGTPLFMAPELLSGQSSTYEADVYALGVLLVEVVTACVPFEVLDWGEWETVHKPRIVSGVLHAWLPPTIAGRPTPGGLRRLARDLLEFRPQDRPPLAEVRARLQAEMQAGYGDDDARAGLRDGESAECEGPWGIAEDGG